MKPIQAIEICNTKRRSTMTKLMKSLAVALALLLSFQSQVQAQVGAPAREPWSDEVLHLAATLPIQDGGRVKPLSTYVGFTLLKMNGKRTVVLKGAGEDGEDFKLDPMSWFLDCLFYPGLASNYTCFVVQDTEVLKRVGLSVSGKRKRDTFSYNEIQSARVALFERAHQISSIDPKDMTPIERQTLALAHNLRDFEDLIHFLDFTRREYPVGGSESLREIWGGKERALLGGVLSEFDAFLAHAKEMQGAAMQNVQSPEVQAMSQLMAELGAHVEAGQSSLALVAPKLSKELAPEWMTPTDLIREIIVIEDAQDRRDAIGVLTGFEKLRLNVDDRATFKKELEALHAALIASPTERGEYGKIESEVAFYKNDLFTYALILFLLAFLQQCALWIMPNAAGKGAMWLTRSVWLFLSLGAGYVVTGIVWRCILRSRPPVSTLYETILFITAVAVIVCMVIELINRQRIALGAASILGALGMFLQYKYELKEAASAGDTMPSLVAVLDTNYYLAIHVTSITMGYAAGLVASFFGHAWILTKVVGSSWNTREISRMLYGALCFSLIFSIFGTIMGGVWANDSWGRFWGWDPKENGALMICLWQLLMLHMRMGGYIKNFGLAIMSILGGMVVAFSWFGVNLLGIGLHSYGFTNGVFKTLVIFYGIEICMILIGCGWWLSQRNKTPGAQPS